MIKKSRKSSQERYKVALALVLALGVFLSFAFFYGPSPINGADNYLYSDFAHWLSQGNLRAVADAGVLAQQYVLVAGIAAFYALLGPDRLSSSLFGVLCYLLTIIAIYLMGTKLYNRKAGLLSAFFYSFNPIAAINSSYVGDNGPMALFVSLCIMFVVFAIKEKREGKRHLYYALSGFFSMIGILVTSQSILILPVAAIALLFHIAKDRNRKALSDIGFFAYGLAVSLLVIMSFGMYAKSDPLYILTLNSNIYSSFSGAMPQFNSYIIWLFPFGLTSAINSISAAPNLQALSVSLSQVINNFFNVHVIQYGANQSDGFFGYFAALGLLYLIARGNKRVILPALWFLFTFLYLGLGTLSFSRYIPIGIAYPRLMLLYIPAMALIMGFAAANVLEFKKAKLRDYLSVGLLAAMVAFLFLNSLLIIRYVDLSQHAYIDPLLQISRFIGNLPTNITIYSPPIPLSLYTDYRYNFTGLPPIDATCGRMRDNSYVIMDPNASIESACNLEKLFAPQPNSTLSQYDLFDHSSFGVYNNVTVYHRVQRQD